MDISSHLGPLSSLVNLRADNEISENFKPFGENLEISLHDEDIDLIAVLSEN